MTDEPAPDGTLDLPETDRVADDDPLAPGKLVGRFVIRRVLGEGGMGIVVAGEDPDLARPVAIKLVKPDVDHPAYRARLLREAQAMARIEHPHVLRVYEVGSDHGRLFVAMELVDGVTLTAWLRTRRRSWRDVIALFEQIGEGLAVVHRTGLVHRDFKPDNVLVDRDGRARVADFGLARLDPERAATTTASPQLAASLTRTGVMMGTPGYMAPEQQFGGDVDARADQYAYCVALREALLGGRKGDVADIAGLPRRVRAIIARGLSYDPSERFAAMDELLAALRKATRRRGPVVLAILGGTAIATTTAVIAIAMTSASREPEIAAAAPPIVDAPVQLAHDAAVVAVVEPPSPIDAAVPVVVDDAPKPKRAGSAAVTLKPPPAFATPDKSTPAPPPSKPELHEMVAAHRPAVRDAIAALGYGGLTFTGDDRDADLKDLRDKLAAATTDLERGVLLYGIGAVERKRANCGAAEQAWLDARKALVAATKVGPLTVENQRQRDAAFRHLARTWIGSGLCELAYGSSIKAQELLERASRQLWGVPEAERAELWLAIGIAQWENGDVDHGKQLALQGARHGTEPLRRSFEAWAKAVGLTLP
ncbi:MAG TPA: protein kinase [Kofleriaceae bacterium]|nr:protein kinase [Kofleriaceae bacterium]